MLSLASQVYHQSYLETFKIFIILPFFLYQNMSKISRFRHNLNRYIVTKLTRMTTSISSDVFKKTKTKKERKNTVNKKSYVDKRIKLVIEK